MKNTAVFFIRKQVVINEETDREAFRNKVFRDEELELLQLIQLSEAETKTDVVSEKLKFFFDLKILKFENE